MSCIRFQQNINKFIRSELDAEDMDFFVGHAKKCRECYDELEINYIINVGLERIEKDSKASFDLKGELERKLKQLEEKADRLYKFNVYNKIVCITAYTCMVAVIILSMFDFLGIF